MKLDFSGSPIPFNHLSQDYPWLLCLTIENVNVKYSTNKDYDKHQNT
jgi:hypothetical protein